MPEGSDDLGESREVVLKFLRSFEAVELGDSDLKVYHELRDSYSWKELTEHVRKNTEVGRRWVLMLEESAAIENKTLESFLFAGFESNFLKSI